MRVLGIDPGLARTGYGIVEPVGNEYRAIEYGCIYTGSKKLIANRLEIIYNKINEIIVKHQPDVLAIERLFFAKNAKSAMNVGRASGVSLLAASIHNLEVYEYTPRQVKLAVCGYGPAAKEQVKRMTLRLLNLDEIKGEKDISDALAVAICHINRAGRMDLDDILSERNTG